MTKPDFTPDAYSMKMEISKLKQQLAKSKKDFEVLESSYESLSEDYADAQHSIALYEINGAGEQSKQLAKATNEVGQHKITAEYATRHLSQCEAALRSEQDKCEEVEQQLAKANERIRELEQAIDGELILHCSSTEGSPKEKVERLLDVSCSWALDPKVSEQANKFAIEKKAEAFEKYASMCEAFRTVPSIEGLRHHAEQLRKGQE